MRLVVLMLATMISLMSAGPASAQFFMQNPDYTGRPVRGDEPGVAVPLPNANAEEMRAGLVWSLRAALNVAALGCNFEPILLTVPNYSSVLTDHSAELKSSFNTLEKYFGKQYKNKKQAQSAFDQYQTKVYASFTTVYAQYNFCQTASTVGRDALFIDRGKLGDLAQERIMELRNSLTPKGEQRFGGRTSMQVGMAVPRLDPICWDKKNRFDYRKCPSYYY